MIIAYIMLVGIESMAKYLCCLTSIELYRHPIPRLRSSITEVPFQCACLMQQCLNLIEEIMIQLFIRPTINTFLNICVFALDDVLKLPIESYFPSSTCKEAPDSLYCMFNCTIPNKKARESTHFWM